MLLETPQPQNSERRCRYRYNLRREDEYRCDLPLTGRARRYCEELHKESGPKQNKAITQEDEKYDEEFRIYDRARYLTQNSNHQYRSRNEYTKPKLQSFIARAKTAHEEILHEDDFLEYIVNEINDVRSQELDTPSDLSSIAIAAKTRTSDLLRKVQRYQAIYPNAVPPGLFVHVKELQRDVARRKSSWAFTKIAIEAEEVRKLWYQLEDLLGLACALFAKVELLRIQYLATGKQGQFLHDALQCLDSAKYICKLATKHYSGGYKQQAFLLGCYLASLEGTLACDAQENDNAINCIKVLDKQAKAAANDCTSPIAETLKFSCRIHQAEFYMRTNNTSCAETYFEKAVKKIPTPYYSVESQLEVAYVKAGIALAAKRQTRHEDFHHYFSLFQSHPYLTHYKHLRELARLYRKDVDTSLLKDIRIYFDPMFRRLPPFRPYL